MDINYNKNFFDCYSFNKPLDKNSINAIINLSNSFPITEGITKDSSKKHNRKSNLRWIPQTTSSKWLYTELKTIINYANDNFFGFDITNYDENIQFTEYNNGGKYDWHRDMILDSSFNPIVRKLSIVIQLSSPQEYIGGILQLKQIEEEKDFISSVPRQLGYITVFPSFMLHKVTQVVGGNRKSLVWWVGGSPFK